MPCDLNQLRTFFVLAKTLSYTAAAKKLFVTQPAVSRAVKKLADGLGCRLVAKRGKRRELTEEGRLLYRTCEDIFYRLDETEESIRRRAREFLGTVRLGATVEFGNHVLIKNMRPFLDAHDDLRVDFLFRHDLLPRLLSDELDIIIDCRDYAHPGLQKDPLFREEYVVVGSPGYLKRHRVRTPLDLPACRLLSMDGKGEWWKRFLQALPPRRRPALTQWTEINHIRGIIGAALEGIGLALVPRYCVLRELRSGRLRNLFPGLAIHEDHFSIYQKRKKSGLEKHRVLVEYLKGIRPEEFGVAMEPAREGKT